MYEKVCKWLQARQLYLNVQDRQIVEAYTKFSLLPKNHQLMEQGKVVKKLYFLNRGVVRLFRVHRDQEFTLGLVSTHDFVSTPLYLQNGHLSTCGLEALTPLEVLEWSKADFLAIKSSINHAERIEMAIMDRLLTWIQDSQIDVMCLTAEERYQKLLHTQSELFQQIPLKYIASYLGIHQDSLSRIRKLIR